MELLPFLSAWKNLFFYMCNAMKFIKCLVCDNQLMHLQVQFATSLFLCHVNEYDKYQGEEHDALLTELKESAELETIKLVNRLFV